MGRPANVHASAGYWNLTITWAPGANDHQELYLDPDVARVQADCANGCLKEYTAMGSGRSSLTVTGLQPGTTYYYKIVSVKDCGKADSGVKSASTTACEVTPPSSLQASPSYNTSVLTWTPGANGHQELYLDPDKSKVDSNCANGCLKEYTAMGSGRSSLTITGLQPGTTYYYKIVSVKDCGSRPAEGSFSTLDPIQVSEVRFINRQRFTTKDPPAAVVCFLNHDDRGALYAVEGGLRLRRHGSVYRTRSGRLYAYFIPYLGKGTHHVECKVNRSLAMGTGNSGSYTITGPSVQVDAENGVIGLPVEVDANISSDFYVNRSTLYVDGSAVQEGNYASQHSFSVANAWAVPLLPGEHEIKVVAKDYVGNTKAASTTVNVSDAAVSCAISPSTIDGDTDFSVSCYDMSGSQTACPGMDVQLQDSRAGTISGTHFDMNETYDGITSLVADAGAFQCRASVVGSGVPPSNATGLDLTLSSKKYFKGEPVVGKVVVYKNGIPVDPMALENPEVVVDRGTPFEKELYVGDLEYCSGADMPSGKGSNFGSLPASRRGAPPWMGKEGSGMKISSKSEGWRTVEERGNMVPKAVSRIIHGHGKFCVPRGKKFILLTLDTNVFASDVTVSGTIDGKDASDTEEYEVEKPLTVKLSIPEAEANIYPRYGDIPAIPRTYEINLDADVRLWKAVCLNCTANWSIFNSDNELMKSGDLGAPIHRLTQIHAD